MSISGTPFFTVILATYNRAKMLREAIQSVLDQTFQDFELLVVDDHSTDSTREVVDSFPDRRIKYVLNHRSRGGAGNRNAGIFRAQGEWVAFLDDDDLWMPEKLDTQFQKIKVISEDVGLIYSGYIGLDYRGRERVFLPQKEGWILHDLLHRNYIGTYSTVAIRTDILRGLGGLDESFPALQDREMYIRVCRIAQVANTPEVLTKFRSHGTNRISTDFGKRLRGNLLFVNKYSDLVTSSPRLKHIWSARVFLYASLQKDLHQTLRVLPWTLAGLFLDPLHFKKIMRRLLYLSINHSLSVVL